MGILLWKTRAGCAQEIEGGNQERERPGVQGMACNTEEHKGKSLRMLWQIQEANPPSLRKNEGSKRNLEEIKGHDIKLSDIMEHSQRKHSRHMVGWMDRVKKIIGT